MTEELSSSSGQSQQAFQALANLAALSRRSALGLPAQVNIKPHWSGIGFGLLGRRFVVPMGEISEMLEVPTFTRLPGVQPWVKGVANIRGRLLPVYDLANFMGGHINTPRKQQRILILEDGDLYTGLLVDQVFGMQHFPVDTYSSQVSGLAAEVLPFVGGSYQQQGLEWVVFSPRELSQNSIFLNAAQG